MLFPLGAVSPLLGTHTVQQQTLLTKPVFLKFTFGSSDKSFLILLLSLWPFLLKTWLCRPFFSCLPCKHWIPQGSILEFPPPPRIILYMFSRLFCLVLITTYHAIEKAWKDPDTRKDWRQEKGTTEDEMVGWHHQLNEHEFEQTPGDDEGQGSLVFCSQWGHKESDMTEWLNNNAIDSWILHL